MLNGSATVFFENLEHESIVVREDGASTLVSEKIVVVGAWRAQ